MKLRCADREGCTRRIVISAAHSNRRPVSRAPLCSHRVERCTATSAKSHLATPEQDRVATPGSTGDPQCCSNYSGMMVCFMPVGVWHEHVTTLTVV